MLTSGTTVLYNKLMKECNLCHVAFLPSSRHNNCPKCRKEKDKKACSSCGKLMQRKSKMCRSCYLKSIQYPQSKVKHLSKDGYVYVYFRTHPSSDKGGRVYEHRLIMERQLDRYLLPFENVHHKNGVKNDNRIENLELWTKFQPTGGRVEDVVKWAKEILKIYGGVSSIG